MPVIAITAFTGIIMASAFTSGPTYRDCSFYREMWEETGRFKWKRRYYECKGWW